MCLLSLLAKRHEYGNLVLLWLLFFLQNNHKTSTCLVLCLKYGLIWAHVVPASLLRIYIYISSLCSLAFFLKYRYAKAYAGKTGFAVQNGYEAVDGVSVFPLRKYIISLSSAVLSQISLRLFQNIE